MNKKDRKNTIDDSDIEQDPMYNPYLEQITQIMHEASLSPPVENADFIYEDGKGVFKL